MIAVTSGVSMKALHSSRFADQWQDTMGKADASRHHLRLSHRLARGLLHLTAVNPYIVSALPSGGPGGGPVAAHLPREPGRAGGKGAVGVSGFAFQGTNAHVIVGRRAWTLSHGVSCVHFRGGNKRPLTVTVQ